MNKNNYILLGMAISYFIIAVIQMRIDGLLPASLYVTVAFASLDFSIMEMIKNLGIYLLRKTNELIEMNKSYSYLFERSIKTYSKFTVLDEDIKEYENAMISLQNDDKKFNKYIKRAKFLYQIISIVSCAQIIICTIHIIITPLKAIPYDKMTTETINTLTLISFAMMFLSFFFSSIWGGYDSDSMEKQEIYKKILTMHLDILDKIASEDKEK